MLMSKRNIDAMLVTQRENLRYLTGFSGSSGCLLVSAGIPLLITDFRYKLQARVEAAGVRIQIQKKDLYSTIGDAADDLGINTLWIDESNMTLDRIRALRKKGLRLRPSKDPVAELRTRKDPFELAKIRKAVGRAEESFEELKRFIRPGITERELGLKLEWLMRSKGARKEAFDTIVASGPNGAMPHASVSNRKLRSGDMVTIDFGAEADGYYCDITRTHSVGRPSARQREIHALVLKAQQEAVEKVKSGALCRDIDAAARNVIAAAGHGRHFGHATGHGIGLMVHEGPSLSALAKSKVEAAMVFTIEPGIYVPGWGGVRIEDMVLVTPEGSRVLTSLPRDLEL